MVIGDTISLAAVTPPAGTQVHGRRPRGDHDRHAEPAAASRRSRSPSSRRRPSWSARTASRSRARSPPRARRPRPRARSPPKRASESGGDDSERGSSPCRCFAAAASGASDEDGAGGRADVLVVGLGNPGSRYAATRHNVGFEIADELARRWQLPKATQALRRPDRRGPHRPGRPARRGAAAADLHERERHRPRAPRAATLGVPLDRVVVLHDEIDLPFGEVRSKLGGGLAGHNGLKSLGAGLGGPDFWRVRAGVGRPDSTDPEIVSAHVLGRFSEPQRGGGRADRRRGRRGRAPGRADHAG